MNTDDSNTSIELKELQSNPLTKVYDEILTSPGKEALRQSRMSHSPQAQYLLEDQEKLQILEHYYNENRTEGAAAERKKENVTQAPSIVQKFYNAMPIFMPNTQRYLAWKGFICFLVLFYFFEIPIYIAFTEEFFDFMPRWARRLIVAISFTFLSVDVVLEFFTAYYQHGNLVANKELIARNYYKTYFYYDLVAYLAFCIRSIFSGYGYRWVSLLFYLKYPSLMKIEYQFEEAVLLHRKLRTIYNFAKVILVLQFCFVLFSCIWYMVGMASVNGGLNSWLLNDGNFGVILDRSVQARFFFCYYFSVGTMTTTMGYGDITPLNIYECSCGIAGIMFAVIIFAIMVNFLFKIIEEYTVFDLKTFRQRVAINRFMRYQEVPQQLRERVRQFLNEHWFEEGSRDLEVERQIIGELAPELRYELQLVSYGKVLLQIPLFTNHFSKPFLKELALQVSEFNLSQEEVIFDREDPNSLDDHSLYFIRGGIVAIYLLGAAKKLELRRLQKSDCFGEWSFITGLERKASAQALTYSQLFKVKREDFLSLVYKYSKDFESYWMIRDELTYCQDYTYIGRCWACNSTQHFLLECDVTHYIPRVQELLSIAVEPQERMKMRRGRKLKKWATLMRSGRLTSLEKSMHYQNIVIREPLEEMDQAYQFETYHVEKNYNEQEEFSNVAKVQRRRISRISIAEPTMRFKSFTVNQQKS